MWSVKWVEMDDTFSYHPIVRYADSIETAHAIQISIDELFNSQEIDMDNPDASKVVCEPIMEEIDFENKVNKKTFEDGKLYFCKKCNQSATKIIVETVADVVLYWDEEEDTYHISQDSYNIDDSSIVLCYGCSSDLLNQD
jgi:hypothetical protein